MSRLAALLCTCSLVAIATPAWAQTSSAPADEMNVDEVVVTGSRIARKDYVAESPIVTVGAEAVASRGTPNIEATLNQLPQFTASSGGTTLSAARGGRANVNLRGLGIGRTLVLLDGRRLQPSDPLGAIDLNSISTALLENVEVISGGASAVYGSDAVAGVVNLKLKRNFEGLQVDAQYGQTTRGDGATSSVALTTGGSFQEDRGRALISISYMDRKQVQRGNRPFFRDAISGVYPTGLIFPDGTNLPTQAALNTAFRAYNPANSPLLNHLIAFNPDGTLFTTTAPFLNVRPTAEYDLRNVAGQISFTVKDLVSLQQPMERYTVFGKFDYALTENIELYAQVNLAHFTTGQEQQGWSQLTFNPVLMPVTNPYVPADVRPILASRPRPTAPFTYYFNTMLFGPAITEQEYDVSQYLFGARGGLGFDDWTWDIYGSYGLTDADASEQNYLSRSRYEALINAADGGASLCAGGYNPFSLTPPSQACKDYVLRDLNLTSRFEQYVAEGTIQGGLFDLPAGEIRFAVGAGYRKNSYVYDSDSSRDDLIGPRPAGSTRGSTEVYEAFAELLVPVLKDLPFVNELSAGLAGRVSDYDSVGTVATYKASLDWALVPELRLRAGYQRSVRAPSIGELFQERRYISSPIGRALTGGGDPCDINSPYRKGAAAAQIRSLCLAQGIPASLIDIHTFPGTAIGGNSIGNVDLKEESSDSITVGAVFNPRWDHPLTRKLSASIDYYDIKLKDAIGAITAQVSIQRCFNGDNSSNPTYSADNYYCKLFNRHSSGQFNQAQEPLLNLAAYRTSGVDMQFDWGIELSDFGLPEGAGGFDLNVVVSYLDKYEIQNFAGGAFLDFAGTIGNSQIDAESISKPEWKSVTTATYRRGPAELGVRWRYVDAMTNSANVGVANGNGLGVKAVDYFDIVANWKISPDLRVSAGVLNVGDKQPPEWTGLGATDPSLYDLVQRRWYVSLSAKF